MKDLVKNRPSVVHELKQQVIQHCRLTMMNGTARLLAPGI